MKKFVLVLGFVGGMLGATYAQDGNNICVWNSINNYNGGGGADDLEKGMKCSDEAAVNESTNGKSKTWFYRGELYTLAFIDSNIRRKNGTVGFEAIKAFHKLSELNDPKFKDWDDALKYLQYLGTTAFNEAVDKFQARNYAEAAKFFYSIKDINEVFAARNKKPNIELAMALKNAAIAAENSGDVSFTTKVYQDWIAAEPNALAYHNYVLALKKGGKPDEAKKVVDEGLAKFSKDANLLVDKINFYLENSQYTEALTFINNLLDVEPKNDGALFTKGLAYEKLGKEDSVVYYYTKSAEANPKSIKPLYNLGALYFNKAGAMANDMNALGSSEADQKKYAELSKKRKELFLQSKPFFLKAQAIDPADAEIKRRLAQIESYTAQ